MNERTRINQISKKIGMQTKGTHNLFFNNNNISRLIIEGEKKDFQHATKIKSIDLYIYLHTYMYTYKNKVNVF